jgi:RHS repeat-associated protein
LVTNLLVGQFNHTSYSDVLLQALHSNQTSYLVTATGASSVFSAGNSLATNVNWSADSVRLIAGRYVSTAYASGIYFQALTPSGTNSFTSIVTGGSVSTTTQDPTIPPPTGALPLAAGRTAAAFLVSNAGTANYNVPIWTPPGVGSLQLKLSLSYASRGTDGILGVGWSLSGLSAIARCGRTWSQDGGNPQPITLTSSDRFCLDGQELKLTGGSAGLGGATYATEIESFSLVTANGANSAAPTSFTVTTKNGLIYDYGTTTDSQIMAGASGPVRTWALSQVRDRVGNVIKLSYYNDAMTGSGYTNGTYRIKEIDYPYTASGQGPFYSMIFYYFHRANGAAFPSGYVAGNPTQEPNQLTYISIQNYGSATATKTYSMGYEVSSSTNRTRLNKVQECSASECYPATTIGYQDSTPGWASAPIVSAGNAAVTSRVIAMDLNGDGFTDIVYPVSAGNLFAWYVVYGIPGGFSTFHSTGVTTLATDPVIPADFTGHGSVDLLYPSGGTWWRLYWNGSALATVNTNTPLASASLSSTNTVAADVNGDGLPDLVYPYDDGAGDVSAYVEFNTTAPGGALSFGSATLAYTRKSVGFNNYNLDASSSLNSSSGPSPITVADFNGDGRADLLMHVRHVNQNEVTHITTITYTWIQLVSAGTTFNSGTTFDFPSSSSRLVTLDWNGDGCTDVAMPTTSNVGDWSISLAQCTGNGFFGASIDTGIPQSQPIIAIDWDSDGRQDLLTSVSNGPWQVARSTGTGVSLLIPTGITSGSNAWFVGDFDGDGQDDLGFANVGSSNLLEANLHNSAGIQPDLATSFTDGFNLQQSVTYVPISQNNYTKCSGAASNCPTATFPEVDYQGPLYVVNQFTASDGTGGIYQDQFWYYGARTQSEGRGFEGFYARRTNDSRDYDGQNRLYTFDYTGQTFPYTGLQYQRLVGTSANNVTLGTTGGNVVLTSGTVINQQLLASGQGITETRYFPFVQTNTTTRYEYGALSNALTATEQTVYTYGDGYGNATNVQTTVTDNDLTSPFYQNTWQITIANTFLNDTSSAWCVGLPTGVTVTSNAQAQGALQRTFAYAPDPTHSLCRVKQKTAEPNTPALNASETLSFDTCGNVSEVDVVGHNVDGSPMTTRTSKYNYSYFTSRCQLPESITDALSETTTVAYNYDFGTAGQLTDPNGVVTAWGYDDFGRKILETRPDGTASRWNFKFCVNAPCWGFPDLRFLTIQNEYDANGANFFTRESFYDGAQRLRFDESNRALGTWTVNSSLTYDSSGRTVSADVPFSLSKNGNWTYGYDLLGRTTAAQLLQPGGGVDRTYSVSYAGRTTRVTDPLINVKTYVTDVAGLLRRVTDPLPGNGSATGATTAYDFDDFGNLNTITDGIGAVWSALYNLRGFRYKVSDPNAGVWNFQGDSLNETTSWTDANNQSFQLQYDPLGRVWQRVEPEGTSTWTWGSSAANHNIGSLQSVSGYGYLEELSYDGIGRLHTDKITTDQAYQYDYAYNALGAIDTLTYPVSTAPTGTTATRFKIQYGYSYGFPVQISDVTQAAPTTIWSLLGANEYALTASEVIGPVSVASSYTPLTGELTGIQSGVSGSGMNRQNLSYQWDKDGNLHQRQDLNQNLTEIFTYDALNRPTRSTLNNVQNFTATYTNTSGADQAGNILNRSDVGSYSYSDPKRPHGVTTAGGYTYSYDANGNVVSRNGLSLKWASYNLPTSLQATVNGSTYSSQFSYGPDRERYQQTAQYSNGTEVTSYAGGLFEKVTGTEMGGITSYRHYVPTPSGLTAIIARNSNGSTTTAYALRDHLGSSDALVSGTTGQVGNPLVQESFGAFGQRRQSNWSAGSPSTGDWAAVAQATRHGFTFHEHLDNIGLIHMNGRVYDPNVGRFLSVDPVMGDISDPQSLNAYAYVGNRPLAATDPTGNLAEVVIQGATSSGNPYAIAAAVAIEVIGDFFGGAFGFGAPPPPPPPTTINNSTAQSAPGSTCGSAAPGAMCGGQPNYLFASNNPYGAPDSLNPPTAQVTVVCRRSDNCGVPSVGVSVWNRGELLTVTSVIPPTANELVTVIVNGARGSTERGLGHPDAELIAYTWGAGGLLKGGFALLRGMLSYAVKESGSLAARAAPALTRDIDDLSKFAGRVPTSSEGFFNVVTHADEHAPWVLRNGNWTRLSHRALAKFINRINGYTGGPIRLIACKAGACSTGLAQNLANKLGVRVLAPTEDAIVDAEGSFWTTGTWQLFVPRGQW